MTSREVNFILGGIIAILLVIVVCMALFNTSRSVAVPTPVERQAVSDAVTPTAAPAVADEEWITYTNTDMGFKLMIPKETKIEDGKTFTGTDFEITVNSNQEFQYEQEGGEVSETPLPFSSYASCDMVRDNEAAINGLKAAVFRLAKGCCDAAACSKPYIMHSVEQVLGRRFDITAYGDIGLNKTETTIVNSFQFIK